MVDYRKYIMDVLADKYVFNNSEIADYPLIPSHYWHMKKYLLFYLCILCLSFTLDN